MIIIPTRLLDAEKCEMLFSFQFYGPVDKRQLFALKNMLKAVGSRDGKPMHVTMEDFIEAIDSVGIASTPGAQDGFRRLMLLSVIFSKTK